MQKVRPDGGKQGCVELAVPLVPNSVCSTAERESARIQARIHSLAQPEANIQPADSTFNQLQQNATGGAVNTKI